MHEAAINAPAQFGLVTARPTDRAGRADEVTLGETVQVVQVQTVELLQQAKYLRDSRSA